MGMSFWSAYGISVLITIIGIIISTRVDGVFSEDNSPYIAIIVICGFIPVVNVVMVSVLGISGFFIGLWFYITNFITNNIKNKEAKPKITKEPKKVKPKKSKLRPVFSNVRESDDWKILVQNYLRFQYNCDLIEIISHYNYIIDFYNENPNKMIREELTTLKYIGIIADILSDSNYEKMSGDDSTKFRKMLTTLNKKLLKIVDKLKEVAEINLKVNLKTMGDLMESEESI